MFDSGIKLLRSPDFSKKLMHVNKTVEVVNRLVYTTDDINSIYTFQIFMILLLSYAFVLIRLFFLVNRISSSDVNLLIIFSQLLILLFVSSLIWRVNCSSAMTYSKSKEFNTLLYQMMIDDKNKEIRQNEKLRLHLSMRREVVFNACGFFNLDYTLVHSMIASATTYLVILIQFGQPGQQSSRNLTNLTTTPLPSAITSTM
ncbi:unnamed protein product [Nezara viridula]|uniref:Gustatory receptor n=2 Tax=Nezara viridula TaxID=85310 RepID=A0A9P0EDH5_NEZVI|nr:unnamed protein product [Nezara viridula]